MAACSSIMVLEFCIPMARSSGGKIPPRLYPSAQVRRVIQKPNQAAVGIQVVLLCGLNRAVNHGAGLSPGGGVGKEPFLSGPSQRALYCARHGCVRIDAAIGRPDTRFHNLRLSYVVAAIRSGDDIKRSRGIWAMPLRHSPWMSMGM